MAHTRIRVFLIAGLSGWAAHTWAQDPLQFVPPLDATSPLPPPTQRPDLTDTLTAFVGDTFAYDDNLFRLPPESTYLTSLVGPNAVRGDHVETVSAGLDGQHSIGRETVLLDARVDDNRYARNTDYGGITGNGKAELDWQAGSFLSGQAGVTFNRFFANFQDTLFYGRDYFSNREEFAKAQFQAGPHWVLSGGASAANNTNSNPLLKPGDFTSRSGTFGVHYFTLAEDSVGWDYFYTDGSFAAPGIFNGVPYNENFKNNSARFSVHYVLPEQIVLDANAGYVDHSTPGFAYGAFKGDVWNATLQWQPTAKTQLKAQAYRNLNSYLDAQSAFFVVRGISITPTWTPREKIAVGLQFLRETHDFLGTGDAEPTVVAPFVSRQDLLLQEQATVTYTPRRYLSVKLAYQHQERQSNQARYLFDDNVMSATVTVTF